MPQQSQSVADVPTDPRWEAAAQCVDAMLTEDARPLDDGARMRMIVRVFKAISVARLDEKVRSNTQIARVLDLMQRGLR